MNSILQKMPADLSAHLNGLIKKEGFDTSEEDTSRFLDGWLKKRAFFDKLVEHHGFVLVSRIEENFKQGILLFTYSGSLLMISEEKPDNPAYINIMTQIVSADLEIKNLTDDIANTTQLLKEYQRKVENSPTVEREYNELTLDYRNAKDRYNQVSSKLLQARVAQEMEIQQQGEHFTIADHAYVPTRPSKPNRLAIMLLGFVLASGIGFGIVALVEALDYSIKGSNELKKIEGVDLLTVMPYTPTKEELRKNRIRRGLVAATCLGVICVVLLVVDHLVVPISSVFTFILERMAL